MAAKSKGPKLIGRPPKLFADDKTLDDLEKLGRLHPTIAEVAAFLKVDDRTIYRFFEANPHARDALERGKGLGSLNLRRRMMLSNSPHVMIHVSKTILGWSDKVETTIHNAEAIDPEDMTDAELAALARRSADAATSG